MENADPADPAQRAERHRRRGEVALELGRAALAEREARAALALDPEHPGGFALLARVRLHARDGEAALGAAREALGRAPEDAHHHYLVGSALRLLARHREACAALEQAVARAPTHAHYRAVLALTYAGAGDDDAARAAAEQALRDVDAEDDGAALEDLVAVFDLIGDAARAVEVGREAVRRAPARARAWARLAGAEQDPAQAVALSREALRLDPECVAAWTNLGSAALLADDFAEAERASREALRLSPGAVAPSANLAQVLYRRGEVAAAAALIDAAAAQEPAHPAVARVRAKIHGELAFRARHPWTVPLLDRPAVREQIFRGAVRLGAVLDWIAARLE